MTDTKADQWTWYRAAMAAQHAGKPLPPVSADILETGFYWSKAGRTGGRIPVAIWTDGNGEVVARFGPKSAYKLLSADDAAQQWTWIAGNPVDRETYKFAWDNGKWPDGTPTVAPDAAPAIGDNLPSDPFERLQADVADKTEQAERFLSGAVAKAADKVAADTARNMQSQLLALIKTADGQHETEKKPHLAAGRAVDEKFRFREKVKGVADRLRTVFENFMRAEENRLRAEADRKYREEQAKVAAERARIEAEQAKLMRDDPIQALTSPAPEMPELPLAPEPIKVNVGGGVGRAAGMRDAWVGVIEDHRAALAHYADHPDIIAALEKIVAAAVRAGKATTVIPGVKVENHRRAA